MSNYKTQAITLKSYNLGETDKIIVMYSRDHGIIRCVAKGVKKTGSKLGGRMQTLMANNLFVAKGKNLDIVQQAELIDSFKELKKDISKITYAMYTAELIQAFGLENDLNSKEIYDIFFEGLKNLCHSSNEIETMWALIRFKMLLFEQLGYAVEIGQCVKCEEKNSEHIYFSPELGGVVCAECRRKVFRSGDFGNKKNSATPAVEFFEFDNSMVRIMRDASNFDFPDESEYNNKMLNKILLCSCFNILRNYIDIRLHKKLKTPELIECLC